MVVSLFYDRSWDFGPNQPHHITTSSNITQSNRLSDAILALAVQKNAATEFLTLPSNLIIPCGPLQKTYSLHGEKAKFVIQSFEYIPSQRCRIQFVLTSDQWSCSQLYKFAQRLCHKSELTSLSHDENHLYAYELQRATDLRTTTYRPVFEHAESETDRLNMMTNYKIQRAQNAGPHLTFTKRPFYAERTFDTLFGPEIRLIQHRLEHFLTCPEEYKRLGIPRHCTILLSGLPGSGKTATIKSIINRTKRHPVFIKAAEIQSSTQWRNLWVKEHLNVFREGSDERNQDVELVPLPIKDRILIFEEIDVMGDILLDRNRPQQHSGSSSSLTSEIKEGQENVLTLGDILITLDGVIDQENRIVIMTTNHPEKLDRALVRPGRIDVQVHFGPVLFPQLIEMYEHKYQHSFPPHLQSRQMRDANISAAYVNEIFMRFQDGGKALEVLLK